MCNSILLYYYNRKYNNYYIYICCLFVYFTAKTFTKFIPIIQQQEMINSLNQQLNNEKIKNGKLEAEIIKLRNTLNAYIQNQEKQKNEINSLRTKIQKLQNENQNLNNANILNKENMKYYQTNINEIKELKQTIKELESKLRKLDKKNISINDVIVLNFISQDKSIQTVIPCVADDTFAEVEERLYQTFDNYRNTNNRLLYKGNTILRFKKIKENKIKNGDIILIKPEK